MKSPYVSELQSNQVVTAIFLVQHKDIRQKKSGEPYLSLVLGDRTGEVDAKMWDNASEVMDTFGQDDFVRVRGLLQIHHNRLQLALHKLQRVSGDEVDAADFFPATERDIQEMWNEIGATVDSISNPHLKSLLQLVIEDPEIARRYRIAPAAKNVHHAYIGGLLEHVVSMCGIAKTISSHYRDIDIDLLLAGVILHDLGKISELTYDRGFSYSSEGQLLGHITIGLRMVADKLRSLPEFPDKLRNLLEHMILSHHGELEYGSPKQPMFPEALLLHHIDNLDSKMACMRAFSQKDRAVEGCWTGYNAALDRSLLKKARYLDESEPARVPRAQEAVASAAPQWSRPAAPPASPGHRGNTLLGEKLLGALKDRQ